MKKSLICFFCCISIILNAQNSLTGVVLSENDHKPVEFASVYINGTTKGVYTDSKGCFTISNVSVPCQLVVTHLAYNLSEMPIKKTGSEQLTIYLIEKTNQLSNVSVSGSSRRKQNVEEFKEAFLGNDHWGKNAIMKNDSVLIFSRCIDTILRKANNKDFEMQRKFESAIENTVGSQDSTSIISYIQVFSAKTKSPLLIELPLLGYSVYLDLISFNLRSRNEWADCEYWAYYRFVPYINKSAYQNAKFERNREEVYYNSAKQFCTSLFTNKLKENGYLLYIKYSDDSTKQIQHQYIDIKSHLKYINSNEVQVSGINNKEINIYYFCNYKGEPINLTDKRYDLNSSKNVWEYWDIENKSSVIFKSDTCTIRSNGTIPDNNILFSGQIATKRGGALLPNDYFPKK